MPTQTSPNETEILRTVIQALDKIEPDARERLLKTVTTWYDIIPSRRSGHASDAGDLQINVPTGPSRQLSFGDRTPISPKQFLHEKEPRTDIERVTCLAYYLTHYRETPHFKTINISKLNTEAAQLKFSNTAQAVENAAKRGFLVPATQGQKQLCALGEQFVDQLPDRDAAKAVVDRLRARLSRKKRATKRKTKSRRRR